MKNVLNGPGTCTPVMQVSDPTDAFTVAAPAAALVSLLEQLAAVIGELSDEQYATRPVGVMPSSVGAHVRHCLDHVATLLAARPDRLLDYDHLERGTDVECDRAAAIAAIDSLATRMADISEDQLTQLLRVRVRVAVDCAPVVLISSLGRELSYVLSHTIHHNAILGAMLKTLGLIPPAAFGYAPSTLLASRTSNAC